MSDINHTDREHADAGPSGASAWLVCPSYITQNRGRMGGGGSFYARQGTAAHMVAEMMIHDQPIPPTVTVEGETFEVDMEMLEAVSVYVRLVDMHQASATKFGIEQRVSLDWITKPIGIKEPVFGTADFWAHQVKEKVLTIIDYKHGAGYAVDPEGPQTRLYALMVLAGIPTAQVKAVRSIIIQPRAMGDNVKVFEMTLAELLAWSDEVVVPALQRIDADDKTEVPGPHCKWCPRAGECGALHQKAMAAARMAFDPVAAKPVPPAPTGLSNDDLAVILDQAEMIVDWIARVRGEAFARLDNGQTIEGWKMVPKRANRKWRDEAEVFAEYGGMLPREELYEEPAIRSPAQLEKILKRKRLDLKEMEKLVVRESSGTTLVRDEDPRPAVAGGAKAVFSKLVGFGDNKAE
jgi:hypothetical protein